jgi:hypothetical protein
MITLAANILHEKLHIGEDEIVLNGPPHKLSGQIFMRNNDSESLFIRELTLLGAKNNKGIASSMPAVIPFITSLSPGEEKKHIIKYKLPGDTAPGIYENTIELAGRKRKVKLIVQQNMDIYLSPQELYFNEVAPGKSYSAQLSLTNKGNVPFTIPNVKHVTTLDTDYLCRATSMAMREKGGEGFMAMMDALTKNVNNDMAGWATVSIKENGKILGPGESTLLQFTITLPGNVDAKKDYFGNIRFWNKVISYNIKSHDVPTSEKL